MEKVRMQKPNQWMKDDRNAIHSCNELAEKSGLFSDKYRIF